MQNPVWITSVNEAFIRLLDVKIIIDECTADVGIDIMCHKLDCSMQNREVIQLLQSNN